MSDVMTRTAKDDTSRLEARVPTEVYEQIERAARLRGLTLTAYVIATAGRTPAASSRKPTSCGYPAPTRSPLRGR